MAFSIIIGLKAVFASVSMSYYLKKTFKKDGLLTCLFGVLYAFSGYFCAYYWNIMWLDGPPAVLKEYKRELPSFTLSYNSFNKGPY